MDTVISTSRDVLWPFTPHAADSRLAPPAANAPPVAGWPLWQRVLFRFFFVYLGLQVAPWNWLAVVPGMSFVLRPYDRLVYRAVVAANARAFHIRDTLVSPNGSGDTSYEWAQLCFFLAVAVIATAVWSVLDRRRTQYPRLAFWLRMSVRYYIAAAALSYGVIKLFALQMPFPTLSQLATPLGDLLPMRFSWLFIGYSVPYQFFSGAMETTAGLLLLYRRTVTAGLFAATGAFMNVVMINLAYDVPVKLYASHLLFCCVFLLALDSKRLLNFLVLNRTTPPTSAYEPAFSRPWQLWGARAVKALLIYAFLVIPAMSSWGRYTIAQHTPRPVPFAAGVYDVRRYVVNHDSVGAASADSLRWRDVIIDNNSAGSVGTKDPVFWQRYGRGYFRFSADTIARTLAVWKTSAIPRDSTFLFTMRYETPDTNTIRLQTVVRGDSIHVELARTPRHFQLAERQFHWISEYNR